MERVALTIVGAGPSGLAAARSALARGVRPVVLDRGPGPGGAYRVMPDAMTLVSPRWEDALPGRPLPDGPPLVTRAEELAYLETYAAGLDADFRFGTEVVKVRRLDGAFVLETRESTLQSQRLLVATGVFGGPSPVRIEGLDTARPDVLRACDYRNAAPFAGKRVLVIGGGNSGVGLAREFARAGNPVVMAVRDPLPRRPVTLAGPASKLLGPVLQSIPVRWAPFLRHRIPVPSFVDREFLDAAAAKRIDLRPEVVRIDGNSARFADGSAADFDVAFACTGYRPALASLLEGLVTFDAHGQPLHRDGLSTEHPGFAFLGMPHQRTFVSQFLRGIARDAPAVVDALLGT